MKPRAGVFLWPAALLGLVITVGLTGGCLKAEGDEPHGGADGVDAPGMTMDVRDEVQRDEGGAGGALGSGGNPGAGGSGGARFPGSGGISGSGGARGSGGATGSGGSVASGPWRATRNGSDLPIGAFPAGQEGTTTFYACRAVWAGGVHGGKAFPLGNCNLGFGGVEQQITSYEVLVGALYAWQAATNPVNIIPARAVHSGTEETGYKQYVCRGPHMGGIHPGKLVAGACSIGYGGKEVYLNTFEILLER